MNPHTKIYMKHFNYGIDDFIPCEVCGSKAVDIHHVDSRGMGGDPQGKKDVIENLMALCRKDHEQYGDVPECMEILKRIHSEVLLNFKKSKNVFKR